MLTRPQRQVMALAADLRRRSGHFPLMQSGRRHAVIASPIKIFAHKLTLDALASPLWDSGMCLGKFLYPPSEGIYGLTAAGRVWIDGYNTARSGP